LGLVVCNCDKSSPCSNWSIPRSGASGQTVIPLKLDSHPRLYFDVQLEIGGKWVPAGGSRMDFGSNSGLEVQSQEMCTQRHQGTCFDSSHCKQPLGPSLSTKHRTVRACTATVTALKLNSVELPVLDVSSFGVVTNSLERPPNNAAIGFGSNSNFLLALGISALSLDVSGLKLIFNPPFPASGVHTKWFVADGHPGRAVHIEKIDGNPVPPGTYATIDTGNSSFISYNPSGPFQPSLPKSITFGGGQTYTIPSSSSTTGNGQMEPYTHNVLALKPLGVSERPHAHHRRHHKHHRRHHKHHR
jgi:hypothetical protein